MSGTNGLTTAIADELAAVAKRVQRCMAVIHNGRHGAGAGVVWRPGGFLITNYHVVSRGKIRVSYSDDEKRPAKLVAKRPEFDLALLRIDVDEVPVALVADSRAVKVGQIVLAVGHPWGQRDFVTAGIVSGIGSARLPRKHGSIPIIRSDVVLAPGNSGGPLVNVAGGIIGINTMVVGGDVGVAIPSHVVDSFVSEAIGDRLEVI